MKTAVIYARYSSDSQSEQSIEGQIHVCKDCAEKNDIIIVPTNIFEIVKRKCDENKLGKHQNDVVYLLKNKVWCGYCGKTISSESGTCKNGVVKRYYKCTNRKKNAACDKLPIRRVI